MEKLQFSIEGKPYPIKFGYGATVWLGKLWGLNGVLDVFQVALDIMCQGQDVKRTDVDTLDAVAVAESMMRFENYEKISDIIAAGIIAGGKHEGLPVSMEEIREAMIQDIEQLSAVFMAFMVTMPRPKGDAAKKKTPQRPKKKER